MIKRTYGYWAGGKWVVTMQSWPTWRSRFGDFLSWLEYRLG